MLTIDKAFYVVLTIATLTRLQFVPKPCKNKKNFSLVTAPTRNQLNSPLEQHSRKNAISARSKQPYESHLPTRFVENCQAAGNYSESDISQNYINNQAQLLTFVRLERMITTTRPACPKATDLDTKFVTARQLHPALTTVLPSAVFLKMKFQDQKCNHHPLQF